MLLDMPLSHRARYHLLFRLRRIQLGYTQEMVIEGLNHSLSLRSYRSLEHGSILQEAQIYDDLCAFFGLSYNYDINIDDVTFPFFDRLLKAQEAYDDAATLILLQDLQTALQPYQSYSYEVATLQIVSILLALYQNKRLLQEAEYEMLTALLPLYPPSFQSLLAVHIYTYEYQLPHREAVLCSLFQDLAVLHDPLSVRCAIIYCQHQINSCKNYLSALQMLMKFEQQLKESELWTARFDIVHWKCNVYAHMDLPAFHKELALAQTMITTHSILQSRVAVFYLNMAGAFFSLQEYEQQEAYMRKYWSIDPQPRLPDMFWFFHNQRLQEKDIHAYIDEALDVSQYHEQLQVLWKFYCILKTEAAGIAQEYLMRTALPYLKPMAKEFHMVFLHELRLLVKKTRIYKDLAVYMEQLNIS